MTKYEYTMGRDDLDLRAEQAKTLAFPTLKANLILKAMFLLMDLIYGFKRTLPKFKIIELLARYPYWAWETGAYHMISRDYYKTELTDKHLKNEYALRHIEMGRHSQDNEQWHLMILEEIMRQKNIKQGWLKFHLIPRILTLKYYFLTKLMYRLNPNWSFAMNAAFESHAEHQYMLLVAENPQWENEQVNSDYFKYYPKQKSLSDLLRRIGLDERDHMNESLEELERFKNQH